jgi:hypothetical protein
MKFDQITRVQFFYYNQILKCWVEDTKGQGLTREYRQGGGGVRSGTRRSLGETIVAVIHVFPNVF